MQTMRWVGLAVVFALSAPEDAWAAKRKVAILELQNPAGLSDQEAAYLTDAVRLQAQKSLPADQFQLMTRENILEYLPPGTTLAQCEGNCEVETGRKVGADFVITGDIRKFGTQLKVGLRVHDTATGEMKAAEVGSGRTVDELEAPVKEAAAQLLDRLVGGPRVVADAKVQVSRVDDPKDDGSQIKNPPRDERGFLIVESTPKGARVFINGQEKGDTPYQAELMVGEYVVLVKPLKNLYAAASKRVTVTTTKQRVQMELAPTFGNLRVESEPPGAEILLGSEPTGRVTPFTFKEKPGGRYPVTVRLNLYKPATQTVELGGGKDSVVKVQLAPDFGVLEVTSTPAGADIVLDGESTGARTPHTFPAKRGGEYEVSVSLPPLYLPQVRRVQLADGKRTKLDVQLDANFGGLTVTSEPSGMPVLLDGAAVGSTPLTLPQVTAGVHEVRLGDQRYAAPQQRATIARGKTESLHFTPKPRLGRLNLKAVVVDGDSREPAEAEVWVNGDALEDRTPLKKELLVGTYRLRLRALEAKPLELTVAIREGEETREEAALEKLLPQEVLAARAAAAREQALAEQARLAAEQESTRASRRSVGNWLVGGGIAAAVLGGVGLAFSRTAAVNSVDSARNPSEVDGAIGTGQTFGVGGLALLGTGALCVVSGLITYALVAPHAADAPALGDPWAPSVQVD
jgi:TolB-like protein